MIPVAALVLSLTVLSLTACTVGSDQGRGRAERQPGRDDAGSVALAQVAASPREKVPSALDDPAADGLPRPLVDVSRIVAGGPPPDGIPPIDAPRFTRAAGVGWLTDREPVLALSIGDDHRAYPVQILIWHEIVNDTVAGAPVVVTYCPLCNSALAFDRRAAGRVLDFGTSGKLYNSDLVAYDRQTRSLWPQIEGRAVAGLLTGARLRRHPVATVSWADWKTAHPNGWVLSRDTGHTRDYGRNPYTGYDEPSSKPFLLDRDADPRLPPKTRIVGVGEGQAAVAVTVERLLASRVLDLRVGGRPVVLFARPGLASALDTDQIPQGRDVAATAAYTPVVDGRRLGFRAAADGFTETQTGSRWNLLGHAVAGPLAGRRLAPVAHVDTFWFAWAAFNPHTRLVR